MGIQINSFDDDDLLSFLTEETPGIQPTKQKDFVQNKPKISKSTEIEGPPTIDYDKLFRELTSYSIEIQGQIHLSDAPTYFENLQKSRARYTELEVHAEKNYSHIKARYEVELAHEIGRRQEKTAKEKEAAALVALEGWLYAVEEAKVYLSACKKFKDQLDQTYYMIKEIVSVKLEERRFTAPPVMRNDSGTNLSSWNS